MLNCTFVLALARNVSRPGVAVFNNALLVVPLLEIVQLLNPALDEVP